MRITGVMVYYHEICLRKLWYFCHDICMEQSNELVDIGKTIDESTYQRNEKHINIDNIINLDFLQNIKTLHEVKKSRIIEKAGILQVKYYLYYLKQRGVKDLTAQIDYPLLRSNIKVELTSDDEEQIRVVLKEIEEIASRSVPPDFKKQRICKNCAYHDLCFI